VYCLGLSVNEFISTRKEELRDILHDKMFTGLEDECVCKKNNCKIFIIP